MSVSAAEGAAPAARGECFDEAQVLAFADGTLDPDACRKMDAHLDSCEACRELIAAIAADLGESRRANVRAAGGRDPSSEPPDPAILSNGTVISGRFRVIEPLGAGASAMTYRVADEQLGEESALKVLMDHGGGASRRVARELVIARKLNHPNVCRVHDVGRTEELDFFSMELISGDTLETVLKRGLPEADMPRVLDQICAGMEAAHAQGIVHRDLKPSNIMVESATGRAVLMDFGLAADLDSEQSRGRIVGTPAYWAPEQARGEEASKSSDVYSFGLIAYKMLTGRAFKLSDPEALARLPRRYRAVIEKCLESSPRARYADAASLRVALRERPRRGWAVIGLALAGVAAIVVVARPTVKAGGEPAPTPIAVTATTTSTTTTITTSTSTLTPTSTSTSTTTSSAVATTAASPSTSIASSGATHGPRQRTPVPAISAAPVISAAIGATKPANDLLYKQ